MRFQAYTDVPERIMRGKLKLVPTVETPCPEITIVLRHTFVELIPITKELVENGIPETSIIWSLSDEGEEVDCVVEFKGKIWIFELKDRDFGPGDAHPFVYRGMKYNADKVIIFTSGRVSEDARKVFEKVSYGRISR